MTQESPSSSHAALATAVRERFLEEMSRGVGVVAAAVQVRLTEAVDEPALNVREQQSRREAWVAYRSAKSLWIDSTRSAWRSALSPEEDAKSGIPSDLSKLELVGTQEVENNILASRLVSELRDRVYTEMDDLKVRMRRLEGRPELAETDILRPEVLVGRMVDQWAQAGMPAHSWILVAEVVKDQLVGMVREALNHANALLISKDILPVIGLKDRVRAPVRAPARATSRSGRGGPQSRPGAMDGGRSSGYRDTGAGSTGSAGMADSGPGRPSTAAAPYWGPAATPRDPGGTSSAPPYWGNATSDAGADQAAWSEAMAAATPPARAEMQAQGMVGRIRRIFVSRVGQETPQGMPAPPPSAGLMQAMARQAPVPVVDSTTGGGDTVVYDRSPAGVARVAGNLRAQTSELKDKAETKSEKATIEIVALMFQAILAEERIPPGIRVWFARLQMPVLRMALEDPDFFATTDHPARLLIDRMGSCVMGFEPSGVQGAAMETEVKRIVQVIEQYPETGKKVYQIVYGEFQKFLARFLTEKESTKKVVSVAQQVEQRETLAIQYTIEMRDMLKELPVRDEVRDFLFKVWSEVLAVSALRLGAKHADTLALKKCATDLVWAASAKPSRVDRAKVIADLPKLLTRLRSGMTLLGMAPQEQEAHIKAVSDTLADAFMSKTKAIPQAQIDAMAERLNNLEDFVSEDGVGDLPLDTESIEMMLGIDAAQIEVVADGGSKPTPAMSAWALELNLGAWFTLDHNGVMSQVQFAWRSDRKQLNLFAATTGKTYLIQAGRLAAYLQAGLLRPQEEEALTIRATRDALTKLEANPERLLA